MEISFGDRHWSQARLSGARQPSRAGRGAAAWVAALLAVLALGLAACGDAPPPNAAALLSSAQTKFDQTKSFHFVLKATNLGSNDPLPVTGASGDVQRPDEVSATATVNAAGFTVTEGLVIIGSKQWMTNPLTGSWETTNELGGFLTIFDAQKGVGAVLAHMQQPSAPKGAKVSDVPCWQISGKVAASDIAALVGETTASSGKTVATTVCIGQKDSELYSVSVTGAVTANDTAQTTRTFSLSNFDKPVSINPPV